MNVQLLPKVVLDVEALVGITAALALVEKYGGTRIYVPNKMTSEHDLSKLLGIEAASALSKEYGRDVLTVPRCADLLRAKRNTDIRARYDAGETTASLARLFGLTERTVWRILSELPDYGDNFNQLSLL